MTATATAIVRRPATWLAPITFAVTAATVALPALATQQRSFVASTGNDAASCTLASPCRSFGIAIAHTNAGGEVIVLDSAGYGPTTITKAVSLIAPAGVYAGVTVATGDGIVVDAPGEIVVLRGLAINGQGGTHGVRLHNAAALRIESCVISGMNQDGIHHEAAGAELTVLDTVVRDNGNFGINLIADASVLLDHVRSEHNDTSGLHVGAVSATATAAVADSVFSANGVSGIVISAGGNSQETHVQVDRSLITNNASDGVLATSLSGAVTVGLAGNVISRNGGDGVRLSGTQPVGSVFGTLSGNMITDNLGGLHVTSAAHADAAANTMSANGLDIACDGNGVIVSIGNNFAGSRGYNPPACHVTSAGD